MSEIEVEVENNPSPSQIDEPVPTAEEISPAETKTEEEVTLGKRSREEETDENGATEESDVQDQKRLKEEVPDEVPDEVVDKAVDEVVDAPESETSAHLDYQAELEKSALEARKIALTLASTMPSSSVKPAPLSGAVSSTGTASKYVFTQSMTITGDTASLEIVPEKVGLIIGVKGSIIKEIQSKTGSRVHVDQNFPDGVNRQIKITGTTPQINAAVDLIIKIADEGPMSLNSVAPGAMVSSTIECAPGLVGRVIGGSGAVIKDIQSRTGAKIQIDQNFPEGVNRKIIVTGSPAAVSAASQLVHHVMEHGPTLPMSSGSIGGVGANPYGPKGGMPYGQPAYGAPMPGPYGNPYGPAVPRGPTPYGAPGGSQLKVMEVAKQFVGRIIGKKGENVVNIAKASGCQVRIDQDIEPCRVNITGPASGIPIAEAMIQEIMLNMKLTGSSGLGPHSSHQYGQPQSAAYHPSGGGYGMQSNYYGMQPQQAPSYNAYGQPQNAAPAAYPGYGMPTQPSYGAPHQPYQNGYPYQPAAGGQYAYGAPAAAPAAAPAPVAKSAWTEYKTDDGRSYWHNPTTNTTQWERPAGV